MKISAIIPVINEAPILPQAIKRAWESGVDQVIVCDGGSDDESIKIAEAAECVLIQSRPGRGPQQNAGAKAAEGELLLFLHADIWLPAGTCEQIRQQFFEQRDDAFGGFHQRIENSRFVYRLIEFGNSMRVRWRGLIYGDQAIFISKSMFERVGGFPDEPLMEDLALSAKLKRQVKPRLLPGPVNVDARRWEQVGPLRQTARNWRIATMYYLGWSPDQLVRLYDRK